MNQLFLSDPNTLPYSNTHTHTLTDSNTHTLIVTTTVTAVFRHATTTLIVTPPPSHRPNMKMSYSNCMRRLTATAATVFRRGCNNLITWSTTHWNIGEVWTLNHIIMKKKQHLTCKCTNFGYSSHLNQCCNDFLSFVECLSSYHHVFYKIWNKFDEKMHE